MSVMRVVVDPKNGTMDEAGHIISRPSVTYKPLYRILCLPDAEWQRAKLESLRHKWRYHTTDIRIMRRLAQIVERVFHA